jgi:Phosphatidylglycerol lysyltransferase, C-terminal
MLAFQEKVRDAENSELTLLDDVEGFVRITLENRHLLAELFQASDCKDSYLLSPAYYLMTGRRGLWAFIKDRSVILACLDPHANEDLILFPPIGDSKTILADCLNALVSLPITPKLARVHLNDDVADVINQINNSLPGMVKFVPVQELDFDWLYPVRVLSTEKVQQNQGKPFMYIRNRIKQMHKKDYRIEEFDSGKHTQAIYDLVHRWAASNTSSREAYHAYLSPYEALLDVAKIPNFGMDGVLFYVEGKLSGLAMWDVQGVCANLFVNLCDISQKGLSEFMVHNVCAKLHRQGVPYLNMGGSETPTLDFFKKKFQPAYSLDLCSFMIEFNPRAVYPKPLRVQA